MFQRLESRLLFEAMAPLSSNARGTETRIDKICFDTESFDSLVIWDFTLD